MIDHIHENAYPVDPSWKQAGLPYHEEHQPSLKLQASLN